MVRLVTFVHLALGAAGDPVAATVQNAVSLACFAMPLAVLPHRSTTTSTEAPDKYDGFRAWPTLNTAGCGWCAQGCLPVADAVLEGEIVHMDDDGRPQFYSSLRRRTPQRFVAFDLLWLNGRDMRQEPLFRTQAHSAVGGAAWGGFAAVCDARRGAPV
jgi:hypothetical protein